MIDIVPTILEATGIPAPDTINGIKQRPMDGVSMVYTWDKANANAPSKRTTQYFEMLGNRAIYHEGWVACTTPVSTPWDLGIKPSPDVITGYNWELYNIDEDFSQSNDLAATNAGQTQGDAGPVLCGGEEVRRAAARQLDARAVPHAASQPDGGTHQLHLHRRVERRSSGVRSEHPRTLLQHRGGGRDSRRRRGRDDRHRGRAIWRLRLVSQQRQTRHRPGQSRVSLQFARDETHRVGRPGTEARQTHIAFDFKYDGPGFGKGGTGTLSVDGKEVATKTLENTVPIMFPEDETFDVGMDTRTPVSLIEYHYDCPFKFTGKINRLTFTLGPHEYVAEKKEEKPK